MGTAVSGESGALSATDHQKVFEESILPKTGFANKTSFDRPKAIILAGQPGAGKGGLANSARNELNRDVVTIDPDALRDFHPDLDKFREAHPYTWSGLTHEDASQWAKELRNAAVRDHKNIIVDTTLGHGDSAIKLVNELRSKGYDVEIRAIATHKLESELGVDKRFAESLEANGYGRYVPQEVRDNVYEVLPENLNKIHAQTNAGIRIFDREGSELYDRRTNTKLPGEVLQAARDARLADPERMHALSGDWRVQQAWHHDLPQSLEQALKVAPQTAQNLLIEHGELNIVEHVRLNAAKATAFEAAGYMQLRADDLRPSTITPWLETGAAAATLYDAANTAQRATNLLNQNNVVGAQSELLHFSSHTLGMLGGAVLGVDFGAALGIESAPGAFITGAVGGVVDAVGGEKIATAIDNFRIYNHDDKAGNHWHYDAQHPAQGWTRTITTNAVDPQAVRDLETGMVVYKTQTLTAAPALTNELNYKASSVAVQLALKHAPVPTTSTVAAPIAENLRDFRHAQHPLHSDYQNTLLQVHAMEDKGRMAHGSHSEQLACALVDAMDKERFGASARVEMRGPNHALQAVAHTRQPDDLAPDRQTSVDVNKAMSRSVQQHSENWSRRALPHVHQQLPAWEREGDPRHRDNPEHGLFNALKVRIPDASDQRLLQFTDACHRQGISERNLGNVHFDHQHGIMRISGGQNFDARTVSVDLKQASPPPAQSIQNIQQTDQQQAQIKRNNQAQSAQVHQQGPMR